jgi:hypothetical protein
MTAIRTSFFHTHKRTLVALLFGLAFSATLAYAMPPTSPYLPSDQQLDPGCAPTDTNCTVDISSVIRYVGTSYVGKTSGAGADGTNGGTAHNIFIGDGAGADGTTVSNAIALGAYANTGGFSNSIIVGNGTSGSPIANTKANQFMLAPTITEARLRGIDYSLPASQAGGAGYVLINNGSGTLSWGAQAGAGGAISLLTNGVANGSQSALDLVAGAGIALSDNGTGSVLITGPSIPDTLYSADGTVSSARVVSYVDNLWFYDVASNKTGLALNPSASTSILGDISMTATYLAVDNTSNLVTIGNGSLSIPVGASSGYVLTSDSSGNASWQAPSGGGGSGTVTNFSFTDGNGFTGSVSNTTTTPALSLTLQDAAADGATKGQVAFDSNDFNVSAGIATIDYVNGQVASTSTNGFLTSTDWNTFNNKFDTPTGNISQYVRGDGSLGTLPVGLNAPITIENTSSLFSTGFLGTGSGSVATDAIFLGVDAGNSATDASRSLFLGLNAGNTAANAAQSIFLGTGAGDQDTVNNTGVFDDVSTFAKTSILIGHHTSTGGFSNSIALGAYATNTAANQFVVGSTVRPILSVRIGGGQGTGSSSSTVFIGNNAGADASGATASVFIGASAGNTGTSASFSNFIGYGAGGGAHSASNANFIGALAGDNADNASGANFIGAQSGFGAFDADNAVFIGSNAGYASSGARISTFIGQLSGSKAVNATNSTFIGYRAGGYSGTGAGNGATNAANSIFIGSNAGFADTVDNTTNADDFSILLGNNTRTGGFSNSIALGANATNTATNQFMIGSTTRPIDTTRINGTGSTQCTITTGTGIACTSDERLKTDITDLSSTTLDTLLNVKTVTYQWLQNPDSPQQIGFLAQDLEQYFPQLVATDKDGYKSVYYAQMTPILVEAIREMNLKIIDINDLTKENTWRDALVAWLGSATNGIGSFFSKEVHTDTLCVKKSDGSELCLTGDQLQSALNNQGTTVAPTTPVTPDPVGEESTDPTTPTEVTDPSAEQIPDSVVETPVSDPAPEPAESPETPTL